MMKNQVEIIVLIIIAAIGHAGCAKPVEAEPNPVSSTNTCTPALFLIATDGSLSYDFQQMARRNVEPIIREGCQGSVLSFWWISADSYLAQSNIVTTSFDEPPPACISDNVYDRSCDIKRAVYAKRREQWERNLISTIASAVNPNAQRTDIYGFLTVASEKIQQWKGEGPVYIVIFSDLDNNVYKYEKYLTRGALQGAHVIVAVFEHNTPKIRTAWTKHFQDWGVAEVTFIPPDESNLRSLANAIGFGKPAAPVVSTAEGVEVVQAKSGQ